MGEITKFISKKSREESTIEHFNKIIEKAKSKQEIRKIEMKLLKPKPIESYRGKKSGMSTFQKKSLVVVFKTPEPINDLSKIIKINQYISNNTYDTDIILELLRLIKTERIEWNVKKKKFYLKTMNGRRIRI